MFFSVLAVEDWNKLYTLVRILEGSWEFAQQVYMCFIDPEKVNECAPQDALWGEWQMLMIRAWGWHQLTEPLSTAVMHLVAMINGTLMKREYIFIIAFELRTNIFALFGQMEEFKSLMVLLKSGHGSLTGRLGKCLQ